MTTQHNIPKYWRSLDELESNSEFQQFVQREFPTAASELPAGVSRRRWLQIMGASFTLASLAGCRWETEKIAPFADRPDGRIPGEPQRYATSIEYAGRVRHLLVTCYDGRPIKIEGNPDHQDALGASDAVSQACILDLYDPDRKSRLEQIDGRQTFSRSWNDFESWLSRQRKEWTASGGKGLAILLERTTSPSAAAILRSIGKQYPKAQIYFDDSLGSNERQGAFMAFGSAVISRCDLSAARVLLTLDADLFGDSSDALRYTREYAAKRDPNGEWMNRLYSVESSVSITGAAADHRMPLRASDIELLLSILESQLDDTQGAGDLTSVVRGTFRHLTNEKQKRLSLFVTALLDDLSRYRGESLIVAGISQTPAVHARVHRLNHQLGNVGRTITNYEDHSAAVSEQGLQELAAEIQNAAVETLVVLACNPVYTAPAELAFDDLIARVPQSISLTSHDDETVQVCSWQLPATHPLEAWGDVRARDGTISVSQPLIAPLLSGRSPLELLAMLAGDQRDPQTIVRESIDELYVQSLTNKQWRQILHAGMFPESRGAATPRLG